jgi:hypothetical protein
VKVRRSLLKDTVAVETWTGEGAYGPVYAAAVNVQCSVDATRRLVRNADGAEVVSEATLQVHPDDAALFVPESALTIEGRASKVITESLQRFRGQSVYAKVTCS